MKALVYTEPHHVEIQDLPEPTADVDEVVIRVAAGAICGSDLHGFEGRSRIRVPPMVMGHEFVGRIVARGAGVVGLADGQRVVVQPLVGCGHCRYCAAGRPNICPDRTLIGAHRAGGFAEYVAVPARAVYPIGDRLEDAEMTLVEPLGNALHMLDLAGPVLGRDVVVLGAGSLGLLAAAAARIGGARHVIVTDVTPSRLEVARSLGADLTVDGRDENLVASILAATDGGAEVVIDAAGFAVVRRQAIEVAAPGGAVVFLGLAEPESVIPVLDIVNRELVVRGSYSCSDADFRHAIALLESGRIAPLDWLLTIPLDQGQQYFQALASHTSDTTKVVFNLVSEGKGHG